MPAALSPEGKIEAGLRELNWGGRPFVDTAKFLGVKISHGGFSQALSGKKTFDRETADRLLDILERARQLQHEVGDVPIDFAASKKIAWVLTVRFVAEIDKELNHSNDLDETAQRATQSVK